MVGFGANSHSRFGMFGQKTQERASLFLLDVFLLRGLWTNAVFVLRDVSQNGGQPSRDLKGRPWELDLSTPFRWPQFPTGPFGERSDP